MPAVPFSIYQLDVLPGALLYTGYQPVEPGPVNIHLMRHLCDHLMWVFFSGVARVNSPLLVGHRGSLIIDPGTTIPLCVNEGPAVRYYIKSCGGSVHTLYIYGEWHCD